MAQKNALEFEVLSDAGNTVARQFGLAFSLPEVVRPLYARRGIDLSLYNGDSSNELPVTGTFVVAQDRTIHLAHVDVDYLRRLGPSAIIQCLSKLATSRVSARG